MPSPSDDGLCIRALEEAERPLRGPLPSNPSRAAMISRALATSVARDLASDSLKREISRRNSNP